MGIRALCRARLPIVAIMAAIVWGCIAQRLEATETLGLTTGSAKVLEPDRTVHIIAIGDPSVVDATAGIGQTMALAAKAVGVPNVITLDDAGSETSSAIVRASSNQGVQILVRRGHAGQRYAYAPGCECAGASGPRSGSAQSAADGRRRGES